MKYALAVIVILMTSSCFKQPAKSKVSDALIIYPPPPAETRIQYLTSYSTSADFSGEQSAFSRFLFGVDEPTPIIKPYGITVHGTKIYICDTGLKGIVILDLSDRSFEHFIPGGKGLLQLPINCHLDEEGNLYVADGNRRQVVVFDPELNYKGAITLELEEKPTDVFADASGIYICALDNHKIYVYNKTDLSLLRSFPDNKEGDPGFLFQPANLTVANNLVQISDIGASRVHLYSTNGEYLHSFGESGKAYGQFTRPKGIAADREGNIYVVDAAFENIQIFNPGGELLLYFGGTYTGPGGMYLPADVSIDYNNLEYFTQFVDSSFDLKHLVFVSNQYGPDKISVYGFVEQKN